MNMLIHILGGEPDLVGADVGPLAGGDLRADSDGGDARDDGDSNGDDKNFNFHSAGSVLNKRPKSIDGGQPAWKAIAKRVLCATGIHGPMELTNWPGMSGWGHTECSWCLKVVSWQYK